MGNAEAKASTLPPIRLPNPFQSARGRIRKLDVRIGSRDKIIKLMRELPHLVDNGVAKIVGESFEFVSKVRQAQ